MENKKDKRATPAEIEQRVTAILPYYLSGKSIKEIRQIMSVYPGIEWDVSERQLYRYIEDTRGYLEKHSDINRKEEIGKVRYRLEELFKTAMKQKDINQARLLLKDYCELFGLKAPVEIQQDTVFKVIIEKYDRGSIKD